MSQDDYLNYHIQAAERQRQMMEQAAAMIGSHHQGRDDGQNTDEEPYNEEIEMSKDQIWRQLEEQRFYQLRQAAVNLQSDMLF